MEYLALLIPVVAIIAVFTFVSIAAWAENRRKERESYYRHETYKKLMEQGVESSEAVQSLMRERTLQEWQRRVEGLRLGGMITFVLGLGAMIFLYAFVDQENLYLAGLIPALIGLVLMLYGFFLIKRPEQIQ